MKLTGLRPAAYAPVVSRTTNCIYLFTMSNENSAQPPTAAAAPPAGAADVRELQHEVEKLGWRIDQLSTVTLAVDRLERRTDSSIEKLDKLAANDKPKETWWGVATKVLGVPALVVLMYMQLSQGKEATDTAALKRAEIAKVNTEEIKTRAELQTTLDELTAKRAVGTEEYQRQLSRTLPELTASLDRLQQLNVAAVPTVRQDNLTRYLLVWVFLIAVGVLFSIINSVWSPLVSIASSTMYAINRGGSKRAERVRRLVPVLQPLLYPIPSLLHILIDVALFTAVLIPLFNQLAASVGSPVTFEQIVRSLARFDFTRAVELLRSVVVAVT